MLLHAVVCRYGFRCCKFWSSQDFGGWFIFIKLFFDTTGKSFVALVRYMFKQPDVKSFLSQRICQDPLERFFGCQRQRGAIHDNPNVQEFVKNTQALRVIKCLKPPARGNCRGGTLDTEKENVHEPLPKRRRNRKTAKPLGLC